MSAINATVHKTLDHKTKPALRSLDPSGQIIALDATHAAHVSNAAGWTVRALDGSIWITQDGDIRDVVIAAGQSFVIERNAPTLLSGFGKARISLRLDIAHSRSQPGLEIMPSRRAVPQWSLA